MSQITLLERLAAADEHQPPKGAALSASLGAEFADKSRLVESVMHNLKAVLNSRAGCCQTRPDYGMPDFNDLVGRFPDAIAIIVNAVRHQIEAFEPRLTGITVRHVPDRSDPLRLAFRIQASLVLEGDEQAITFDTFLNNDGYVNLTD